MMLMLIINDMTWNFMVLCHHDEGSEVKFKVQINHNKIMHPKSIIETKHDTLKMIKFCTHV